MGDNAEAAADLADLANLEVYNDPDGGAGLSEIKAPPLKPSGRPPRTVRQATNTVYTRCAALVYPSRSGYRRLTY